MEIRAFIVSLLLFTLADAAGAQQQASPIIFPKENSIVGSRVNVVLDPTEVPFFQVVVGKTEYPIVDTSSGKHAYQGVGLEPGLNTVLIRIFSAPQADQEKESTAAEKGKQAKQKLILTATWERKVYSMIEVITGRETPTGFTRQFFHSREHETGCSGCHNLEAPPSDAPSPKKPEDMICSVCHQKIPMGKRVHGPVVNWNCLACHNPEVYPVKYQFSTVDPWTALKSLQTVVPMLYTIPANDLFKPGTAKLLSRDDAKNLLRDAFDYAEQNSGDRVRLEVHTDNAPPLSIDGGAGKKGTGKQKQKQQQKEPVYKTNEALTEARAKVLASLFNEAGISLKRVTAVGMGEKLPKTTNATEEGRNQNNRVEIVVFPANVKVKNSQNLPVLADRDRIVVNLAYAQGSQLKSLSVIEKLPLGRRYMKGSGSLRGRKKEPELKGEELIWELGETAPGFSETLSFIVKKDKGAQPLSDVVKIAYTTSTSEGTREFDPKIKKTYGYSVKEACLKCHNTVLEGEYKHGPADAGYCNLCHNPHASASRELLREPSWPLCITCHKEKDGEVHVLAGFMTGPSHPTKGYKDPVIHKKHFTCSSCHEPHSAESRELFNFDVKRQNELCAICHGKK